jgi:hypothetical protein
MAASSVSVEALPSPPYVVPHILSPETGIKPIVLFVLTTTLRWSS